MTFTARRLPLLIALILFLLAAFGVATPAAQVVPLGFAIFAAPCIATWRSYA